MLQTTTDVVEAIAFIVLADAFKLEKAGELVRKLMMLVWSKDAAVKEAVSGTPPPTSPSPHAECRLASGGSWMPARLLREVGGALSSHVRAGDCGVQHALHQPAVRGPAQGPACRSDRGQVHPRRSSLGSARLR